MKQSRKKHGFDIVWYLGSLVKFIFEAKSISKQNVLIVIISKFVQWPETILSKLASFCGSPCRNINVIYIVDKQLLKNLIFDTE